MAPRPSSQPLSSFPVLGLARRMEPWGPASPNCSPPQVPQPPLPRGQGWAAHLFLIPALQELQGASPVPLTLPQGAAMGLGQARGRGDAAALWVHPGIDVVGDVTPRDAPR